MNQDFANYQPFPSKEQLQCSMVTTPSSTLYIPIASPPTPAPSPSPTAGYPNFQQHFSHDPARLSRQEFASLAPLSPSIRRQYLSAILSDCTSSELLFISITIAPLLKRDFLRELPTELALHVLSFIDDPKTLARAAQVSKRWRLLLTDEWLWKSMCNRFQLDVDEADPAASRPRRRSGGDSGDDEPADDVEQFPMQQMDPTLEWFFTASKRQARKEVRPSTLAVSSRLRRDTLTTRQPEECIDVNFSYRKHFKFSYTTMMNWRHGGHLLRAHRLPIVSTDSGVITSVALDPEWVVVGLANCKIYIFSAKTGVHARTLVGHELGVWAVNLVSKGGFWGAPDKDGEEGSTVGRAGGSRTRRWRSADDEVGDLGTSMARLTLHKDIDAHSLEHSVPPSLRYTLGLGRARVRRQEGPESRDGQAMGKRSDPCCASEGWGQPNALVVSGGCDKVLRVWDVKTGYCIYVLHGHTSTIRCVKVLHNRPIAVTGSRDATLRVWDVQRGRQLRVLHGHQLSVRCLDVCGNQAVSGSYDTTCRLWDIDTGQCLHVLRGHMHQIYSVAFDGVRIASGGLDTTVRVWDAATGTCTALLQGHTALVCQLQLSPTLLATGGSDGRVITFCLRTFCALHRIAAHDSSVTSLQCDSRFLVTGGNDGRVRLFETATGNYVRELSEQSDSVWKVVHRGDVCAIMCKRAGKTVMEIWSYGAGQE